MCSWEFWPSTFRVFRVGICLLSRIFCRMEMLCAGQAYIPHIHSLYLATQPQQVEQGSAVIKLAPRWRSKRLPCAAQFLISFFQPQAAVQQRAEMSPVTGCRMGRSGAVTLSFFAIVDFDSLL